jgi:hypothetical protein
MSTHRDGEIVGLHGVTNGRVCNQHACCGDQVTKGSLVFFKEVKVTIGQKREAAVQAILVHRGVKSCAVGFIPRIIVATRKRDFIGKTGKITELYDASYSVMKRRKSHRNEGMASFRFVDNLDESGQETDYETD